MQRLSWRIGIYLALLVGLWADELAGSCVSVILKSGTVLTGTGYTMESSWIQLSGKDGSVSFPVRFVQEIVEEACPMIEGQDHQQDQLAGSEGKLKSQCCKRAELVDLARELADQYGLPEALVLSVVDAESGFRTDAVSSKGAIGLMQLMPETARALGVDPTEPRANLEGGIRYLRHLLFRYLDHPRQLELALAAYNAGPGRVEQYGGVPPFRETRKYVAQVLERFLAQYLAEERAGSPKRGDNKE